MKISSNLLTPVVIRINWTSRNLCNRTTGLTKSVTDRIIQTQLLNRKNKRKIYVFPYTTKNSGEMRIRKSLVRIRLPKTVVGTGACHKSHLLYLHLTVIRPDVEMILVYHTECIIFKKSLQLIYKTLRPVKDSVNDIRLLTLKLSK